MNGPRISRPVGILMITVAAVIDAAQFFLTLIPFIGWFVSMILGVCALMLFFIWFHHYKVNLFTEGRSLGTAATTVADIVPFINGFPWWTFRIVVAVKYERWKGGTV